MRTNSVHPQVRDNVNSINQSPRDPQALGLEREEHVNLDIQNPAQSDLRDQRSEPRVAVPIPFAEEQIHRPYTDEDSMPIIWLDPDVHEGHNNTLLQKLLTEVTKLLKVYNDIEECEEFIRELPVGEQIILIIAGSIGSEVIPLLHDFTQLSVIYIYAREKKYYEKKWKTKKYPKVRDVITNPNTLLLKLRREQDAHRIADDETFEGLSVNIYKLEEKSWIKNQLDANGRFMWMYLFIKTLLGISELFHSSLANIEKHQLVKELHTLYHGNVLAMNQIEDFSKSYRSHHAIRWYTRESPLYVVLNKALREKDLKLLLPFRFFIFDIYQELQLLYDDRSRRRQERFVVYRGQLIASNAVIRLKNSANGYVSMNSFISTTLKKEVALQIVNNVNNSRLEGCQPSLFEIEIDPSLKTLPYALIQEYSYYKDEEEVLFSPGSIFKIKDCYEKENDECVIQLELCSGNEEDLEDVVSYWEKNIESGTDLASFGCLIMMQTNQLDEIEKFYKMLKKQLPSGDLLMRDCYNGLGNVQFKKNQFQKAIRCHIKANSIAQTIEDKQEWLAIGYTSLADAYLSDGDKRMAIHYYETASGIFETQYSKAHRDSARCHSKMGKIYQEEGDFDKALTSFNQALRIYKEINPSDVHNRVSILIIMSEIQDQRNQYTDALNSLRRALKVCQRYLSTYDQVKGSLYEKIGDIYTGSKDFISALSSYHKAAEVYYHSFIQQDEHNTKIQQTIDSYNYALKHKDKVMKWWRESKSTNNNETERILQESSDPPVQNQPLTTVSINDSRNRSKQVRLNRNNAPVIIDMEYSMPTNPTRNSAHSSRKT